MRVPAWQDLLERAGLADIDPGGCLTLSAAGAPRVLLAAFGADPGTARTPGQACEPGEDSVAVVGCGSGLLAVEIGGSRGAEHDALAAASRAGAVASVQWSANGGTTLTLAADGRVRTVADLAAPEVAVGLPDEALARIQALLSSGHDDRLVGLLVACETCGLSLDDVRLPPDAVFHPVSRPDALAAVAALDGEPPAPSREVRLPPLRQVHPFEWELGHNPELVARVAAVGPLVRRRVAVACAAEAVARCDLAHHPSLLAVLAAMTERAGARDADEATLPASFAPAAPLALQVEREGEAASRANHPALTSEPSVAALRAWRNVACVRAVRYAAEPDTLNAVLGAGGELLTVLGHDRRRLASLMGAWLDQAV